MARGATQTQTQATKGRRAREPSAEDSESDREFDAAAQTQGGTGGLKEDDIASKAADLVRLMLFMEYKRRPVQRPMITQQVLGGNTRGFNAVFEQAQKQLRNTFGMEMVLVRGKRAGGRAAETQTQGPTNGESSTQAVARGKKSTSAKSFILRNVLPAAIITKMSTERPLRHLELGEDEWHEDPDAPDSGALLRWEKSDGTESGHVAMLGIRTIILSLVMCSGRVIQDDHLHALLRRLNLHSDTVLPYSSPDAIDGGLTLDKYLDLLHKQNYLERTRIVGHNGPDAEGSSIEWRWGSREVEFSEKAAGAFIEMIFMDTTQEDSESEEEEQEGRRRRRVPPRDRVAEKKAKREKLRVDIAKAAGGELEGKL